MKMLVNCAHIWSVDLVQFKDVWQEQFYLKFLPLESWLVTGDNWCKSRDLPGGIFDPSSPLTCSTQVQDWVGWASQNQHLKKGAAHNSTTQGSSQNSSVWAS